MGGSSESTNKSRTCISRHKRNRNLEYWSTGVLEFITHYSITPTYSSSSALDCQCRFSYGAAHGLNYNLVRHGEAGSGESSRVEHRIRSQHNANDGRQLYSARSARLDSTVRRHRRTALMGDDAIHRAGDCAVADLRCDR